MEELKIRMSNRHEFTFKEARRMVFWRSKIMRGEIGGANDTSIQPLNFEPYQDFINDTLRTTPSQRRRERRQQIKEQKRQERLAMIFERSSN